MRRILLVKLRAIGDSVLCLPSVQALHAAYPKAALDILAPAAARDVFSADKRVHEVLAYERGSWGRQLGILSRVRARRYDAVICLHASFRTALIALASGAETRVVRNHSGPDWFSRPAARQPKEPKSIIQRDFDALRALGMDPKDELPRMQVSTKARAQALALAKRAKLRAGRSVLLFPMAGKPEKEWPAERFVALAAKLNAKRRSTAFVVAPGAPNWPQALRPSSLQVLGALAAHAGYAVGNDSGPRHIAAACGARTLTLFGPERLREWHPYRDLKWHVALRPDSGRVEDLSLEQVNKEVWRWLK